MLKPKATLPGEEEVEEEILDTEILFEINDRLMANVLFPHKIHTYWLSCKVCHPKPYSSLKKALTCFPCMTYGMESTAVDVMERSLSSQKDTKTAAGVTVSVKIPWV